MGREQEILSRVKGFLVPVFTGTDPYTGETQNGLVYEDFRKVKEGYACAKCLAEFETFTVICPVCGHNRDAATDIGFAPDLWQAHYKERMSDEPVEKPPVVNPLEAIESARNDKEVEMVDIRKLRKKKRRKR